MRHSCFICCPSVLFCLIRGWLIHGFPFCSATIFSVNLHHTVKICMLGRTCHHLTAVHRLLALLVRISHLQNRRGSCLELHSRTQSYQHLQQGGVVVTPVVVISCLACVYADLLNHLGSGCILKILCRTPAASLGSLLAILPTLQQSKRLEQVWPCFQLQCRAKKKLC